MSSPNPFRPNPDTLLAQLQAQEQHAARGRLRIYFGASAGVGKTYTMLAEARKLEREGHDVLVGVVETHGRQETAAMLAGLPQLPLQAMEHRGRSLPEFDLDAALVRRPAVILIDELAHSNVAGSRHPKRWQDVEELLSAGIDVLTTVNVQHLESLNDVVGGITGVRVAETVPDTVFDRADEVVLVDLPADELLLRLKQGKVYQAQQAQRAAQHFFRKGNLIALRELALRRTADRVQDDVQAYRVEKSINPVWKTGAALLACVGPHGGEQVIRSAARLASQLNADWHALYVETPRLQRLPASQRERILKELKLAQDLGARTAIVAASDIAAAVVRHAREANTARLIVGRGQRSSWSRLWPWFNMPQAARIAALAPDIDLIAIAQASEKRDRHKAPLDEAPARPARHWRYLLAAGASLATALVSLPLTPYIDLANIAMLSLLTVVLVAVRLGRGPAALASLVGVASFDFVFVPPRFSFAVGDFQYVITFGVMLAVGLITGHLTAGLRFQARVASHREERARALYEFARELSGVLQTEQVFEITRSAIERAFHARATLLLPDDAGRLQTRDIDTAELDIGIAQWAFDRAQAAGTGTDTLPGSAIFYLPLVAPMRTRGLLALLPQEGAGHRRWLLVPEQRQQLDTFAALAAIALERVHYIDVAQGALVQMESERLRNSLLAALSHDLRTPLTSLVGLAESLALSKPALSDNQLEMARLLQSETVRMSAMVANLLDMARIESGHVQLNLQWQSLEEVVGSALRASATQLQGHHVCTQLAPGLPLVRYDAVLVERVLCNLVENAAKYTPAGSTIGIAASVTGPDLQVTMFDNGPGLPPGREAAIFEKFTRGERESNLPGVGLGLAICRAIVEAHGGSIAAQVPVPAKGAAIVLTLPLGVPPALPEELEIDLNQTGHQHD